MAAWLSAGRAGVERGQPPDHQVGRLLLDALPVVLGVPGGPPGRLLVGVGVSPALLDLLGVGVGVEVAEHLELLLRREVDAHLLCLQHVFDRGHHLPQPGYPVLQQAVLAAQVSPRLHVRVVQDRGDLIEREAELPVEQDLLQPLQVGVVVPPGPGARPLPRRQQPYLVVVVQRTYGDARDLGHPAHGVSHDPRVRPPVTSGATRFTPAHSGRTTSIDLSQ
jgi:hypothetical protein